MLVPGWTIGCGLTPGGLPAGPRSGQGAHLQDKDPSGIYIDRPSACFFTLIWKLFPESTSVNKRGPALSLKVCSYFPSSMHYCYYSCSVTGSFQDAAQMIPRDLVDLSTSRNHLGCIKGFPLQASHSLCSLYKQFTTFPSAHLPVSDECSVSAALSSCTSAFIAAHN